MQVRERDTYVLESLRQAAPMIQNIAIRYTDDYDDLYQVAAETALRVYDRVQKASNPRTYLHRIIRNAVVRYTQTHHAGKRAQTLADHYQILSLDAPLRPDSTGSLYDLVGDAQLLQISKTRDYSRLYAILEGLPPNYRQIICMHFGLCGYGVHRLCDLVRLLGISKNAANHRLSRAKAMLRQYTELFDLVESQA